MRIRVDKARCQGHNRCVALAPALFDVDDNGLAVVLSGTVPADQETRAQRAEQACPERAITITTDDD